MIKVLKCEYIIALLISVGIFNSCTDKFMPENHGIKLDPAQLALISRQPTTYGTYLAARVAHLRQDYNKAASYYASAINLGLDKPEIMEYTYVLMTSKGRIDEAAKYAQKAIDNGDTGTMARFIILTEHLKHQQYADALKYARIPDEKNPLRFVYSLIQAWIYVGENNRQKALEALKPLKKNKLFLTSYYMHTGLINDYFDQTEDAKKAFDTVVGDENIEFSFRSLQIISNFYLRNGDKEKAVSLAKKYLDKNVFLQVPGNMLQAYETADPQTTAKIIDTTQKGVAETLFNFGALLRETTGDISKIFNALALYLNPENDVSRFFMAQLYESDHLYREAADHYAAVDRSSPLYYLAQLQAVQCDMFLKKNDKAVLRLKKMALDFPNNYHVLFNLGEASRMLQNYPAAIDYYQKALQVMPQSEQNSWMLYYALGISYEKNNQWDKAEDILQKALVASNRHPYILNYLGYTWLKRNQNANEALYMIFEAYRLNPEDGHILDSLGWALYRMGLYDGAIKVLESAAEYLPGNAIVCDHLGDAYWQVGRKQEARFQWQHALTLKEDAEEVDKTQLQQKIKNGHTAPAIVPFNQELLVDRLEFLVAD